MMQLLFFFCIRDEVAFLIDLDVWDAPQVLHTALELIQQCLHVHSVEMREQHSSLEETDDQNCNRANHLIRFVQR
jgi:hypothetical protein